MPREKSAGAIIFRKEPFDAAQGKKYKIFYLLLHYPSLNRKGGHWEFSKGHVEEGENEEETMRREIEEETGIKDLKIISGFKKYIKYFFRQYPTKAQRGNLTGRPLASPKPAGGGGWVFKLVVFFIAETQTKEIKISSEHLGFAWLPIEEAIKKTTFKNSKNLLREADNFLKKHEFT